MSRIMCDVNLCQMCSHYNECEHIPSGKTKVDRKEYYKQYHERNKVKRNEYSRKHWKEYETKKALESLKENKDVSV